MNFFEYVDLMKEMNTPVALVGLGLLALFLVIVIVNMLGGMRRGVWRQIVRTGMTLIAAIVSYIAAVVISNSIIGGIKLDAVGDAVAQLDQYAPGLSEKIMTAIASFDPTLIESILVLPATIIFVPIICTVIFLIINLILKIVRAIIIRIFGFKKAKKNPQRLGGALLAAVEGIIWVVMVTLPVCGILSLADQAYGKAIEAADDETKTTLVETYDEYILPFTENPAITFVDSMGAKTMYNGIATIKIDKKRTKMREEILSMADVILIDGGALKGADFTALTEDQKAAVTSIVDALGHSPFASKIIVSVLKSIPQVYNNNLIPLDKLGGEYQAVIDSFMVFFATSDTDKIGADLNTIKSFYFGFCDSGIMAAIKGGDDIMQFITNDYKGEKHILSMINTLSGNPRTQAIVDGLYNLVLNVAFSGASNGDSESVLDINIVEVKNGLNNIVSVNKSDYETVEEYREVLSETISTTINDTIGVELEKDVVDEISSYVDENFSEQLENLTDEEFNELIFEVIDIYQGFLNGDDVNPDDFDDILGDFIP